jgi:hypothetical protein
VEDAMFRSPRPPEPLILTFDDGVVVPPTLNILFTASQKSWRLFCENTPLFMNGIDPVAKEVAPVPPWLRSHGVLSHLKVCTLPLDWMSKCGELGAVLVANVCVAVVRPFKLLRFAASETAGAKNTAADTRTIPSFFIHKKRLLILPSVYASCTGTLPLIRGQVFAASFLPQQVLYSVI